VSELPTKYADRVTADVKGQSPAVERFAAVLNEKFSPVADELQQTVTRLTNEHFQTVNKQISEAVGTVADIVVKHMRRELAERDEIIRRLTERVAALEAAGTAGR
jgi:hypothetical protein